MSGFTLIDLYAQRHAVASYVLGWAVEDVLMWLGRYGAFSVLLLPGADRPFYSFRSFVGLTCPFYFDDSLNLVVPTSGWFYS